ncbi:MAG: hypothetical protein HC769_30335 [Cyanobacteria bacterium CRU_2_1]|nr:hypothetical protein [Cyanobacteria bacterium CRU_2_1]
MQHTIPWLADIIIGTTIWSDSSQHGMVWCTSIDWHLVAQFNTDVFRPAREFLDNFIKSGQVWALLIGMVLGYLFRSLTSYG